MKTRSNNHKENLMIIYKITNTVNKKVYIGKTEFTTAKRFEAHIKKAKKKTNRYLYDAMNHYGYDKFVIEKIDDCISNEDMNNKERYWISYYKSNNKEFGYNMTEGGDGGRMSPELYERIAAQHRGVPLTEEHKQKISLANMNRIFTKETRQKLSEARKGIKLSKETKQKISLFHQGRSFFRGKHHSAATKLKLSEFHQGRPIHSEEEKNKRRKKWLKEGNPNYKYIDEELLLQYIKKGLNNEEIAKIFSCSPATIIEKIKAVFNMLPTDLRNSVGIKGNRKIDYKPIDFNKLEKIMKDGQFRNDVAKQFNLSGHQLNTKIKNKYGFGFSQLRRKLSNENY